MNALQIIPPEPLAKARRSTLLYLASGAILLLAVAGGIGMSRGEEGIVPEGNAASVEAKDSPDKAGNDDKSAAVTPAVAAPEAKPDTASNAATGRDPDDSNDSRALVQPPATSPASIAPKSDLAPKSESAKGRKTTAMATRPAGLVRRAYRRRDVGPVWAGPPPVIYGPPDMRAPYVAGPASGMKRQ